jgi:hypothetical protein
LSERARVLTQTESQMGKKFDDAAAQEAPSVAEVEGLKNKIAFMEEAMQKQTP